MSHNKHYLFNYHHWVNLSLPPLLRQPKLLAMMTCLLAPLKAVHSDFRKLLAWYRNPGPDEQSKRAVEEKLNEALATQGIQLKHGNAAGQIGVILPHALDSPALRQQLEAVLQGFAPLGVQLQFEQGAY